MEEISIHHLSQFITEDIFLLPDEFQITSQPKAIDLSALGTSNLNPSTPLIFSDSKESISGNTSTQTFQEDPIPVLGNFEKGVLILIEEVILRPEVMDMLVKMLNAVGHSMNEVGIIHSNTLDKRSMRELQSLNAHTLLKFGRLPHPISSLPATPYHVYVEGAVQYLFADALSTISEDNLLKKKLWVALQILFNISK